MKLKVWLYKDNQFYSGYEIGEFIFADLPINASQDLIRKCQSPYITNNIRIANVKEYSNDYMVHELSCDCIDYEIKMKLFSLPDSNWNYQQGEPLILYAKGKFAIPNESFLIKTKLFYDGNQIEIKPLPFIPQNSNVYLNINDKSYQCNKTILLSDGSIEIYSEWERKGVAI